jgi:hypothetical protein
MPVISGFGVLAGLPWEHINDKIERRVLAGEQGMIVGGRSRRAHVPLRIGTLTSRLSGCLRGGWTFGSGTSSAR